MNKVVSDEFINKIFEGTDFGVTVNRSVAAKRDLLYCTLQNQINGFWAGSTMYSIMVNGGFFKKTRFSESHELTHRGREYLNRE